MSNINVNLDVRNEGAGSAPGYTSTTASDGSTYYFKYTGGSDGNGGVEESASAGSGTITVQIGGDPRYTVSEVKFGGDIENQLSWAYGANTTVAVITDADTSSGDGTYSVIGHDSAANCTFRCDPPIKNNPT